METKSEKKENIFKKPWVQSLAGILIVFGILAVFLFWQATKDTVFVENSHLDAPIINLSSTTPGILNALYVKEGDVVEDNTPVALIGSQTVYTKSSGVVSDAPVLLGAYFNPGQTVVSVVNNNEMKVVGEIEENKGLKNIIKGQYAIFSVDAFPKNKYEGVVDEISPVSNDTGVVFSISDTRPIKKFNIKIRFDVAKYGELKSGMSAKITIYTKK